MYQGNQQVGWYLSTVISSYLFVKKREIDGKDLVSKENKGITLSYAIALFKTLPGIASADEKDERSRCSDTHSLPFGRKPQCAYLLPLVNSSLKGFTSDSVAFQNICFLPPQSWSRHCLRCWLFLVSPTSKLLRSQVSALVRREVCSLSKKLWSSAPVGVFLSFL